MEITLRVAVKEDLSTFFLLQTDKEALHMAAFTSKNPFDKEAYIIKWSNLLLDKTVNIQSIIVDDTIVGCVAKYFMQNEAQITYTVKKELWGKGIASIALEKFLLIEKLRPIYGRVAHDNLGSQRILIKNNFKVIGEEMFFANARNEKIKELIYILQ